MILSLLYKNDPEHLKLMMIDPKMLEFSIYDEIPHLITPVITEPKKAIAALANMVAEMERRYRLMADKKTKNIDNYNEKVKRDGSAEPMPFIVIIIDELADLMMNGGKEVETSIARLAQKSRACGIHLIVATQRPSVDVVTGIIKANLPSRLSYRVGQKIDSKVILDSMGAESLLGRGDGLFTPPGMTGLVRIHAPWATEEEIEEIVEFIKAQRAPEYDESYLIEGGGAALDTGDKQIDLDPLYEEAKAVVLSDKKTSISYLQRKLQIGYNRSANIIDQLEATGVLSPANAKGNREILI
jgi:S-DNA-T family DNA segregation ATPase FtsK/SpoIIIE